MPVTPADSNAASEIEQDEKAVNQYPDSYFAKYNVRIPRPQYTNEDYETHMKSEDWSMEETNYLVDLAIEYDLRWVVITDRYDYKPSELPKETQESLAVVPKPNPRTQEDMKSRYYTVAAQAMSLRIPVEKMSSSEFETHEKMIKYNPVQEANRKRYAEQLLARSEEEKNEEEMLLKELSRIVLNQEKLFNERKALYDRLDAPKTAPSDHSSTTMYQSSAGLTHLMQTMLAQSKSKELEKKQKRQSGTGPEELHQNGLDRQRQSLDNTGANKRGSISSASQSHHRHLAPRDQIRFGVSYPTNERLVGGVTFRNERAMKITQAKSTNQTNRIRAALSELKVPPQLVMPTAKVVAEYEKLLEGVKGLVEIRKVMEKVQSEIKTWQEQKEQIEARERGEDLTAVAERRGLDGTRDLQKESANSGSLSGEQSEKSVSGGTARQGEKREGQSAQTSENAMGDNSQKKGSDPAAAATNGITDTEMKDVDDLPRDRSRSHGRQAESNKRDTDPTPTTSGIKRPHNNDNNDDEEGEEDGEGDPDDDDDDAEGEDDNDADTTAQVGNDSHQTFGEDDDDDDEGNAEAEIEGETGIESDREEEEQEEDDDEDAEVQAADVDEEEEEEEQARNGGEEDEDDQDRDEEEDEQEEEDEDVDPVAASDNDEDEPTTATATARANGDGGEDLDDEEEGEEEQEDAELEDGGGREDDEVDEELDKQGQDEDVDANGADEASPAATPKPMRKRSASVISAVSNKSNKRQRK